jgi:Protein of unknown function (DUF2637)
MSEEKVGGARKRATRFFWCTLILATGASVCGNVAHAVLAQPEHAPIAATAACVPPTVLLGATHGVALLVRARTTGATYWCALALTVMLAGCAFVLSFDALRALALTWAGFPASTAWLWPLAIDLSIAQSTLALLALSGAPRKGRISSATPTAGARNGASVHNGVHLHPLDAPVADFPISNREVPTSSPDWTAHADQLISAGVTRIDRDKVATVLAELEEGVAPSTVARRHGVGYTTVTRLAETTKQPNRQEKPT